MIVLELLRKQAEHCRAQLVVEGPEIGKEEKQSVNKKFDLPVVG